MNQKFLDEEGEVRVSIEMVSRRRILKFLDEEYEIGDDVGRAVASIIEKLNLVIKELTKEKDEEKERLNGIIAGLLAEKEKDKVDKDAMLDTMLHIEAMLTTVSYATRGASLVLAARREKSLREVSETARLLGAPQAIAVAAEVSNINDYKRLIILNHLVNCAGVTPMSMLEEITDITSITSGMKKGIYLQLVLTKKGKQGKNFKNNFKSL
ncbi:uncharacterized protein LOC110901925 [Helianthus annuus]|nr:uncharacterized protein LOC110901925 [Helianthus annuus]